MVASSSDKKSIAIMMSVLIFVIGGTYVISVLARGYQINFLNIKNGSVVSATGLLSATSSPKSASVYINDRLISATDDTINLPPGEYKVKIIKDGYLPWEKTIHIKKEVVFQTDTQLYRSVPDLKPITLTGALNPVLSPDGSKIAYAVASASASKDNGLYMIELSDSPLPIGRNSPRQIANNFPGIDWSKFTYTFSPNSQQILATLKQSNVSYLLSLNSPVTISNLVDVTPRLSLIKDDWAAQDKTIVLSRLDKIPKELRSLIATDSSKHITFNTAENKVLYLSAADGSLPDHIIPAPPAQSTQNQSRSLKKGSWYVYDIEDDTNFLIGTTDSLINPSWLPNSDNIIYVQNNSIQVIEYDATNRQTLFAGSFTPDVVYPWSDGSRIVTLIAPYTGADVNLYAIT
ncbi:MAG TPA: PEGA domain-containing protein, partial [Patescibacteria group bacterium]